ncbi:uncharacterized protein [Palaemon carinicauda]|uniref:uncharacterized protein n=1 Tax=Palaemon carinicauda TaxID=392227 RepID=UPI0035B6619D
MEEATVLTDTRINEILTEHLKVDALQEALLNLLEIPKSEKETAHLTTVCNELQRAFTDTVAEATAAANHDSTQGSGQKPTETPKPTGDHLYGFENLHCTCHLKGTIYNSWKISS